METVRAFGWDVVGALALRPVEDDAWMFHTPNLDVVRGVAACMDLPLTEAMVRSGKDEEVEDLEQAIAGMKGELDGIISGALASEYQKTRIDAIGHRLGLKTFAPLWHKEPRQYLHSLVAGGWQIRFSRVAGEGVTNEWAGELLTVEKLQTMEAHRARPNIAGEGGEYETLVTWAPGWRRRIVVDSAEVEGTVNRATWNVRAWHLQEV